MREIIVQQHAAAAPAAPTAPNAAPQLRFTFNAWFAAVGRAFTAAAAWSFLVFLAALGFPPRTAHSCGAFLRCERGVPADQLVGNRTFVVFFVAFLMFFGPVTVVAAFPFFIAGLAVAMFTALFTAFFSAGRAFVGFFSERFPVRETFVSDPFTVADETDPMDFRFQPDGFNRYFRFLPVLFLLPAIFVYFFVASVLMFLAAFASALFAAFTSFAETFTWKFLGFAGRFTGVGFRFAGAFRRFRGLDREEFGEFSFRNLGV